MDAAPTLLEMRNLSLSYGDHMVIRDISLQVCAGEFVSLVGPNGAGKSTLLRAAVGLIRPVAGEVLLFGRPLEEWNRRKLAQKLTLLPQHAPVPELYTVEETVRLGRTPFLGFWGTAGSRDRGVIEKTISDFELRDLAECRMGELSGGEFQRTVLARAFAQEPELLLVDEPTAYLDIHHQISTLHRLHNSAHRDGKAVLAVLHDLNLASTFSDRIILIADGRVLRDGDPETVLFSPEFARIYGSSVRILQSPDTPRRPLVLPGLPETDGATNDGIRPQARD
ncbi:MAG TPA: ABC transporter ATP-binding protein [Spirochaetia bacterium]|nr:ABC transporter ATP-binding protein [Spirochaetia bacterium]